MMKGATNPMRLTVEEAHGRADPKAASLYYELSPSYVRYVAAEMDDPHRHAAPS